METKIPLTPTAATIWLIELGEEEKKKTSKAAAHPATLGPLFTAGAGKQGRKKCKQIHA